LEDVSLDGKIILKYMLNKCGGGGVRGMKWIDVAKFRAVVNTAMNRRVL
jgi:hypothetical protein